MDAEGRQIANLDINIGRDLNLLRRTLKAAMPDQPDQRRAGRRHDRPHRHGRLGRRRAAGDGHRQGLRRHQRRRRARPSPAQVVNSLTVAGKDQVMLKVTVAEIQRVVLKQLGINTAGTWQVGNLGGAAGVFDAPFTPVSAGCSSNSADRRRRRQQHRRDAAGRRARTASAHAGRADAHRDLRRERQVHRRRRDPGAGRRAARPTSSASNSACVSVELQALSAWR